jgi:outer membrane protein assembly factor BamB
MKHAQRFIPLLAVGALVTSAVAQDWPQWRGPGRDAKVAGFTPPKTWPKELAQKWKVTVGLGAAAPSLVGDKLFVFARQEGNEVTLCLDAATGKELWSDKVEAKAISGPANGHAGPRSSPAVADGKVVTLGIHGTLSCFEAATGKKLWRKDDFQGSVPRFFTSSSPIIVDGLCIAQLGGGNNGALVACDLATGEQKWKWAGDSPGYASPVLLTVGKTKLVVAETESKLVAIDAADGKLAWSAPFAPQQRGYNASTPVVDGQTLIYAGSGRGTKAVKLEKEGDAVTAKELWSNTEKSVQFNSPVLRNGLLFSLSATNEFFCINTADGKTAWSAPSGPAAAGGGRMRGSAGYGSILDAGSVLLALTPGSELIAFQPSEKEYAEVARIKVAGTPTYAHLVVSGNRLFVKDQDSLILLTIE